MFRVRATYTTFNSGLHYDFLNSVDPPAEGQQVHPPIFHVTADDFVPSLLDSELDQIDNLMTQSGEKTSKELRELVRGKKEDRPNMTQTWVAGNIKNPRQCNFCRKIGMQTMPQCGKFVFRVVFFQLPLTGVVDASWSVTAIPSGMPFNNSYSTRNKLIL